MLQISKLIPQGRGLAAVLVQRAPTVELDWDVRQKSRFDATDSQGRALGVFLPRGTVVRGGDVLVAEDGSLIRVEAAAPRVNARIPAARSSEPRSSRLSDWYSAEGSSAPQRSAWRPGSASQISPPRRGVAEFSAPAGAEEVVPRAKCFCRVDSGFSGAAFSAFVRKRKLTCGCGQTPRSILQHFQ